MYLHVHIDVFDLNGKKKYSIFEKFEWFQPVNIDLSSLFETNFPRSKIS